MLESPDAKEQSSTSKPLKVCAVGFVGVVGAGVMGRGIAQVAAIAGCDTGCQVLLWDARPGAASAARDDVCKSLERLAEKGKLTPEAAASARKRLRVASGLADFAVFAARGREACVIEAIVENLEAKIELFRALESIVGPECVLATNTSSLSVSALAAGCEHPARVGGFHFFNPVPLMKVVEVIPGARTAPWVSERLTSLAKAMGHTPVRAKDTPGFVVNHAGRGLGTEALRIASEGVATFEDVDAILRDGAGFRMGPFELLDLTGLDVSHPVMESIYRQFYDEPRFRPSPLTAQRLAAGLLGRKSGEGFYAYENGVKIFRKPNSESLATEAAHISLAGQRVWVSSTRNELFVECVERWRGALAGLVTKAGGLLEMGASPSADALCIVFPFGTDATSESVAQGFDAGRVVAIDAMVAPERHRTLMTTPLTKSEFVSLARTLLTLDGVGVSVVSDSAGLVAQRVLATIVNIGCDIAQQRIATPADIELAVTLGLGYPNGPLAWGDKLGARRVLAVLEGLQAFSGDPRYRPSPWLKRRALLGVSLATPENGKE
jgi:3-hydroxybutyryl-CoA dehydrogenase